MGNLIHVINMKNIVIKKKLLMIIINCQRQLDLLFEDKKNFIKLVKIDEIFAIIKYTDKKFSIFMLQVCYL